MLERSAPITLQQIIDRWAIVERVARRVGDAAGILESAPEQKPSPAP